MVSTTTTPTRLSIRTALAAAVSLACLIGTAFGQQSVNWTNPQNVAIRGSSLQKTGGCQGCDDSGAISQQMIRSGNGFAEFIIGEDYSFWMAGLSRRDGNSQFKNIDFAIRFNGNGWADVMENGSYVGGDTPYAAGDLFRVEVADGRVRYFKNGQEMFVSQKRPAYPLVLDAALGSVGSTIQNARIETRGSDVARYGARDRYGSRDLYGVGTSGEYITVNPAERWTDTGIYVEAGDAINFDAEGTIQMSDNRDDLANPSGSRRFAADAPLRQASAGSLIARIGNSAPFPVGSRRRVARAPVSGELFLGVNDDYLDDNSGSYRVMVTVEPR